MTLTELQLRAFLPGLVNAGAWVAALVAACSRFDITTPHRLAAFLAQAAHESIGFTRLVENLNYTTAQRIRDVFPKYFPTAVHAEPYVRQPAKLANKVYANRNGNGSIESGDGWRYRGRGLFQLTGRGNYQSAAIALQLTLVETPDIVERQDVAALTAGHFWDARGLSPLADEHTLEAFDKISYRINGGSHGLVDRRRRWAEAKLALGVA